MSSDSSDPADLTASPSQAEARGYLVALSTQSDGADQERFRVSIADLELPLDARSLVSAQPVQPIVGKLSDARLTIVEFPTLAGLRACLASPQGARLLHQLSALSPGTTWAASGVSPTPDPFRGPPSARAYVVTRYQIVDPARVTEYRQLVTRLIGARGGRYLVRFDPAEALTGPPDGNVLSVVEFPSPQQLEAGIHSHDFKDMMNLGVGIKYKGFWVVNGEAAQG